MPSPYEQAGTMTGRTANRELRPTDLLDISPADAAGLGIESGAFVTARSRYGGGRLQCRVTDQVRSGELFATFHDPAVMVNLITGNNRDSITQAPEYKVTAVRVERSG